MTPAEAAAYDLRAIAIHEAGHAVIGRVLGMPCGGVRIVPDEDASDDASADALVSFDPWSVIAEWERQFKFRDIASALRGRAMTGMAGREAEEEILGHCQGGDGDDVDQVGAALEQLPGEAARIERRLRCATRMLVRRHRTVIELLAEHLLLRQVLSQEEADTIVPVFVPPREIDPNWALFISGAAVV